MALNEVTGPAPVLLIDTFSLLFRAHHALPPMSTRSGEPTAALYGLSALLLKLLREQRPRGLAFALDAPEPTFRHDSYQPYKATRERAPTALGSQLARLHTLLDAFGAPSFRAPGFEADDLLATLSSELAAAGRPSLIVTGDRDLLQLTSRATTVLFVGARGQAAVAYDVERVRQRFGVEPDQLPTWLALVGDASDNLPGVPGIGPRTAARWIRAHGGAARLLESAATLEPARLAQAVVEAGASLVLHERLARLRKDVPLGTGPLYGELSQAGLQGLERVFLELEFGSLVPRLRALKDTLPPNG